MLKHPSATAILIDPLPGSRGVPPSLTLVSGPIGWVATLGFVEKSEVERTGKRGSSLWPIWLFLRLVWPTFPRPEWQHFSRPN